MIILITEQMLSSKPAHGYGNSFMVRDFDDEEQSTIKSKKQLQLESYSYCDTVCIIFNITILYIMQQMKSFVASYEVSY